MSDLISRQAAIKEVEKESQVDGAYGYMDTKSIVDLLNGLPSAQPTQESVPQCVESVGMRWIPVTERLPEYGNKVLVTFRNKYNGRTTIGVSYCYVQKEGFFSDRPFDYVAIAWMPVPEPWKGGEE